MKKNLSLLIIALILFVPGLVNAESNINMSVTCDSNTLSVGESTICRVTGSSDAEGKVSLNQSGVTNISLNVETSGNNALSYVNQYSTANGWYLKGSFDQNIFKFNLDISNTGQPSTEVFTFKVVANSIPTTVKSTVGLTNASVTTSAGTVQPNVGNGFEITVNADPNNKGNNVVNPSTGDSTLLMIGAVGLFSVSIGYVSYRKLKLSK